MTHTSGTKILRKTEGRFLCQYCGLVLEDVDDIYGKLHSKKCVETNKKPKYTIEYFENTEVSRRTDNQHIYYR